MLVSRTRLTCTRHCEVSGTHVLNFAGTNRSLTAFATEALRESRKPSVKTHTRIIFMKQNKIIKTIKCNHQNTLHLIRFAVRLVSCSAATRTLTAFVSRPVHVTVTVRTSIQCDDINSCGFFQDFVTLREVCR